MLNDNVIRIDLFKHQCVACGNIFDIEDSTTKCSACKVQLYVKMTPPAFANLFKECLINLEIDKAAIASFLNVRKTTIKDLCICTELSQVYIDRPFEDTFGGQYKPFFINDTFQDILINNFKTSNDE